MELLNFTGYGSGIECSIVSISCVSPSAEVSSLGDNDPSSQDRQSLCHRLDIFR